jgi:hypothetical protein
MWTRSFVATTVALGEGVDVALEGLGGPSAPETAELARDLSAPARTTRAMALAKAVRDVVVAIDEVTLL